MSRYTGWRKLSGDGSARPDLLDLGKKLLGQLDARRKASGLKTLSIQRQLPDGSIVRARFDGDIPRIDVKAARRVPRGGQEELAGVVVRPRLFSDAFAFGAKADTLLMLGKSRVKPAFFAQEYANGHAGGDYSRLFPDGLVLAGNLDWRNADETLAVTWDGPSTRYFMTDATASPRVHHNGQVIYDAEAALGSYMADVCGAALRKVNGKAYLLVSLFYFDAFKYEVRAIELDSLRNPTITAVDGVSPLVLATVLVPEMGSFYYPTPLLFNQSATEARTMLHRYNAAHQGVDVSELVIDLRDFDAPGVTETPEASVYCSDESTTTTTSLGYLNHWAKFITQTSPAYVPLSGTYLRTKAASVERYRCAVDFRDDVPVYAHYRLPTYSESITLTSSVVQSIDNGATGSVEIAETRVLEKTDGGIEAEDWLAVENQSARTESNTGESNSQHVTIQRPYVASATALRLWWMDLRYKAAAYTLETFNTSQVDTWQHVSEGSVYADEFGSLIDQDVEFTQYQAITSSAQAVTRVLVRGAVVDEVTRNTPESATVLADTQTTTSRAGGMWQIAGAEWAAAILGNVIFESHNYGWPADTNSQCVVYLQEYDPATEDPTVGPALPADPSVISTLDSVALPDTQAVEWQPSTDPTGGWNSVIAPPYDANRNGAWLVTKNAWLFSMRWPASAGFDWHTAAANNGKPINLEALTGGHSADLFMPIWPLSLALRTSQEPQ